MIKNQISFFYQKNMENFAFRMLCILTDVKPFKCDLWLHLNQKFTPE